MKVRGKFDPQYKLEVVHLLWDRDLSVGEVSKTMGVGETAIGRWVTQYGAGNTAPS